MARMLKNLNVCIVGGGHASHALAALFPSKGLKTTWLTTYKDEADRLNKALKEQGYMQANFASHNHPSGVVKGLPDLVRLIFVSRFSLHFYYYIFMILYI